MKTMPKPTLFDEDSEEEVTLKTENNYAKKYDKWREKEELHKLEQKYGSKPLNSDGEPSSDSEDESDEPPEVTEEMEAQFLKTLSLLKTKDPRIYDPQYKFFDEGQKKEPEQKPKTKQLTFADSDDEDDDDGNIFSIEKKAEIVEDKKPRKTSESKEIKIKDYLTGEVEHINDEVEKDLAPLKALWSDPKLNEGEAFLRDYILNKRYLEEGDVGEAEDKIRDDEELEADEERVEEQGKFERSYNFRFEEPDQEYLKRFPRTMNYIRPKDDRRSRKRAEVRSRKEEEKQRKMEEIARLKALKLKEIQDKIARIKEVTGNEELAFREEDLESEFDPAEHDKRMREIFDEQYYGDADDTKPVFPDLDDELEIENWENYEPEHDEDTQADVDTHADEEAPHCEDDDFNMDADYDPKKARGNLLEELKKTLGKKRRNRKKKSKLAELLSSEKPKFVPTEAEKTYDQYMEEYYKMDCEDVIGGDLPTRFKYREVVPNDYGLTVEEILLADDKELTQWVPLKKILKHRPDNVEKGDAKNYAQKAADVRLKKKILPSLFKDLPEEPEIVVPIEETKKKKKKKKKNKQKNKEGDNTAETEQEQIEQQDVEDQAAVGDDNETPKKKKKDKQKNNVAGEDEKLEEQTNAEVNEEPKQKKQKKKHKSGGFVVENIDDGKPTQVSSEANITVTERNKQKKESIINETDDSIHSSPTKGENHKTDNLNTENNETVSKRKDKNLKRKAETSAAESSKNKKKVNKEFKKNFKQNDKFKNRNNVKQPINPLVNLSDERLKAFGLNPKRYKNFMKFKKF